MINITVRTLDSQNHQFSVDENLTVEQFKNHIADTVNIAATRQRIIYCGRVLQNSSKLSDYDVNGKVVHLVQGAPPTPGARNVRSLTPPPDLNRARGMRGNTLYMGMGSMTFPQNLWDSPQMIPPRATHTLSASRLNVARRMLRQAEYVVRLLENPSAENDPPPAPEEPVEEEMTPVIEARVLVPTTGDQPFDENAIINAVQNSIFPPASSDSASAAGTSGSSTRQQLSASAPETPRSSSTENLNSEPQEPSRDNSRQPRRCRSTEMATLLTTLNQLQQRFAPFLARYQSFMEEDPSLAVEDVITTRQMMNRVSKVLHYLGHAYHSLSDIIINVDQPPPRLLLCRPILIHPPALVQTGIPIQVEAQINLSAHRPNPPQPPSGLGTQNTDTPSVTTVPTARVVPTPVTASNITVQPNFVGGAMRLFPLEIHTLRGNVPTPPGAPRTASTFTPTTNPQEPPRNTTTSTTNQPPQQPTAPPAGGGGGGNMEFFMEVAPEALQGGNLVQSLMQLVSAQLGESMMNAQNQQQRAGDTAGGGLNQQQPNSFQQSQARSTQTNPTQATHTRSTPRPHIHMTQQAVQGGFDPFLHCYSHHISTARPAPRVVTGEGQRNRQEGQGSTGGATNESGAASAPTGNAGNTTQNFQFLGPANATLPPGIPAEWHRSFVRMLGMNPQQSAQRATTEPRPQRARPVFDIMQIVNGLMAGSTDMRQANLLGLDAVNFVNPYAPGESLIIDLILLALTDFSISDLLMLVAGITVPLERQLVPVQDFLRREICWNNTTEAGLAAAAERVIADIRPVITSLEAIPTRGNIDMGGSIHNYLRNRLPGIITTTLMARVEVDGTSTSLSDVLASMWKAAKELLALIIRCSANGEESVESVFQQLLRSFFTRSLEADSSSSQFIEFIISSSREAIGSLFRSLNVNLSDVEEFVVLRCQSEPQRTRDTPVESMDVDIATSPVAATSGAEAMAGDEDTEPLPNVIVCNYGSEVWHRQAPETWTPIITRDIERQTRQNGQPPLSDAYLSGNPSKRRKLVAGTKLQGTLPQIISESVRNAVTTSGLAAVAPLDTIVESVGESAEIRSAYENLLQSTVRDLLQNNPDFSADRYPNIDRYFNRPAPE